MGASVMDLRMYFDPYKLTIYQGFRNREGRQDFFRSTRRVWAMLSVCSSLFLFAGCAEKADLVFPQISGELSVEIEGLRSDEGAALVSLFSSEDGFPDDMQKALQNLHVSISAGRAQADFPVLPYGLYAVVVLHDEDLNGKMERSWLGQPREGFGFSGRPEYNFGPPAFDDTTFLLASKFKQIVVRMRYETDRQHKQNQRRADHNGQP